MENIIKEKRDKTMCIKKSIYIFLPAVDLCIRSAPQINVHQLFQAVNKPPPSL
jgi:hypothetical protein